MSNDVTRKSLKPKLHNKRVECPQDSGSHIVPRCAQKEIITESTIAAIISSECHGFTDAKANEYVQKICRKATQLFAILAYMKRPREVCKFLDEGITDEHLPLQRKAEDPQREGSASRWILEARAENGGAENGETTIHIKTLDEWTPGDRENFSNAQKLMSSPFFERGGRYSFADDVVLPFLYPRSEIKNNKKVGGYSEILTWRPVASQHDFWDSSSDGNVCLHSHHYMESVLREAHALQDERLVVVKRLLTTDEKEIENEIENLQRVGGKHEHLIQLFACYEHQRSMHLILPKAECDLKNYWEERSTPAFSRGMVFWSLKQMYGIADGLFRVHEFHLSCPPEVQGGIRMPQSDVTLKIQSDETVYGRHGDLKPENILYFPSDPDIEDDNGILKITDYGLSRFHGRESRSNPNSRPKGFSTTFEPPEIRLDIPVSRAYDLWSLGCVYLEFVTWLTKGKKGIEDFSEQRMESHNSIPRLREDIFFTMSKPGDEPSAQVRRGVLDWVQGLHECDRCSELIHDLLNLIMRKMLRINPQHRIKAKDLRDELECFMERAKEDDYLLLPKPSPPSCIQASNNPSTVRVHFTGHDSSGPSSR